MLMPWDLFKDKWLSSRSALLIFLLSTILAIALIALLWGWVSPAKMSFRERLPWGTLGLLGPIAVLFLYFGMWRYWVRIDDSRVWIKRIWFVVLLIGFWWGSCAYFFLVYAPQVLGRQRTER
jgi:uncharacterized BrkB/YihY/UPF0761 family membrane protein